MDRPCTSGTDLAIIKKKEELEGMKREETQKLGRYFANMPLASRKLYLPRISAGLIGGRAYEIEIIKHAQQYRAAHPKTTQQINS